MLAYTYPLLDIFFTMLWFFAFFVWIWLLIIVFTDIFRSHDIGGFAKALWVILVLFLPLLGVLVYLIARGGKMRQRAMRESAEQKKEFDTYVRQVAAKGDGSAADQLSKLAELRDQGAISEAEFQSQKAKLLS